MILNPSRKHICVAVGAMFYRNNLLLSRPGDLLTPVGGAATHAYFQTQHIHFHHSTQNIQKKNTLLMSSSTSLPNITSPQIPCGALVKQCCCAYSGDCAGTTDNNRGQNQSNGSITHRQQFDSDSDLKTKLEAMKEKLAQNVYFEKYKEKFQQLELNSPRELLAKLEQLDTRSQPKRLSNNSKSIGSSAYAQTKAHTLQEVVELDRIKDLGRDDIIQLWQKFHWRMDGLLSAVMSGAVFDKMAELASVYSVFVMPLPRDHGYEFFFVQYMDKTFHFTPLIAYQTHKENAPECLRLINYTDLQSSKDLVLMRGEYDKNLLTLSEAHTMAVQVNFYYGETSESRKKLLEAFYTSPDTFQHMDLIDEFKKLQASHPHLFEENRN